MKIAVIISVLIILSGCTTEGIEFNYKVEIPSNTLTSTAIKKHAKSDWPNLLDKKLRYKASKCHGHKRLSNKILPICYEVYEKFQEGCFVAKEKDAGLAITGSYCTAVYNMSRFILNDEKMGNRTNIRLKRLIGFSPDDFLHELNITLPSTEKVNWLSVIAGKNY